MVYSFFNPEHASRSLGTFMILGHIQRAAAAGLPHVYLGYWVEGSRKMQYKIRYKPQEHLGTKLRERQDLDASMSFVPANFTPPVSLDGQGFRLEPLGPQHRYPLGSPAWSSSIPHILATPGFSDWPPLQGMSLKSNLADLEEHARDFADRTGFTYTVLEGSRVIGCVYIYPWSKTRR